MNIERLHIINCPYCGLHIRKKTFDFIEYECPNCQLVFEIKAFNTRKV